jgi:hypothetical protein
MGFWNHWNQVIDFVKALGPMADITIEVGPVAT